MRKGEQTKEYILQKAAQLFNERGYFGASMSDIMTVTGMEKGGIYNHFKSKDDLAVQAYEYSVDLMRQAFADAIKGKYHAVDRLQAVVGVFQKIPNGSPLAGGCPVINTAVHTSHTHPQLHASAQETMLEWQDFVRRIVQLGIDRQQLKTDTDVETVTTLLISTLEGAIMLTQLHQDSRYMDRATAHLVSYLQSLALTES
ncbi:MAG: TetR/AcrR family transcriptional regulator [Anaerolineales bacterium]|nr:TetR/AcrR family transcriptional regulator [Anaerolineales bacterium]